MGETIKINRLTNCNIYLDGNSLLGRAEEITLPEIKTKMVEHKGLGMLGAIELPAGFEKFETKIKWSSFYPEVLRRAAVMRRSVQLQVRGSLETHTGAGLVEEQSVKVQLTGTFKKLPMGVFKQHESVECETELSGSYVKLTIGGQEIIEIDLMANIYRANGVDQIATYRRHIGG
jgi:hypothetical protein